MMITFSSKELLAKDREKLPRVAQLAKKGREVKRLPQDPRVGGELPPDPLVAVGGGVKNMNVVRLAANDPESMSISIRPSQRLQHLALQVLIDKVFHPAVRDRLGFETDFAGMLSRLIGTAEDKDPEEGGPSPSKRAKKEEKEARPNASLIEYQRIIRNNVFFSPYLKYEIHFRVSLFPLNYTKE